MTNFHDLNNDLLYYKAKIMDNFNSMLDGSKTFTVLSVVDIHAAATIDAQGYVETGSHFTLADGVTGVGATAGKAKLYIDALTGDFMIVFGDGTVKTICTDT